MFFFYFKEVHSHANMFHFFFLLLKGTFFFRDFIEGNMFPINYKYCK